MSRQNRIPSIFPLAITSAALLGVLTSASLGGPLATDLVAQQWEQPPRSRANLDALDRVEVRSYEMQQAGGEEIEYGVYVPTGYDGSEATPLVVALHGLGSGIHYMMEYNNLVEEAENHGFLVATPMGYNEQGWYGSRGHGNDFNRRQADPGPENLGLLSELDVLNVLAIMRRDFNVDDTRIYLIGQSMGGGGTWHLGAKYPELWGALAPMAPAIYTDPANVAGAREVPVMVVMGDADELVDVEVTREWVAEMEELEMDFEYVEVPGGSHSSAGRENIGRVFDFLAEQSR